MVQSLKVCNMLVNDPSLIPSANNQSPVTKAPEDPVPSLQKKNRMSDDSLLPKPTSGLPWFLLQVSSFVLFLCLIISLKKKKSKVEI